MWDGNYETKKKCNINTNLNWGLQIDRTFICLYLTIRRQARGFHGLIVGEGIDVFNKKFNESCLFIALVCHFGNFTYECSQGSLSKIRPPCVANQIESLPISVTVGCANYCNLIYFYLLK